MPATNQLLLTASSPYGVIYNRALERLEKTIPNAYGARIAYNPSGSKIAMTTTVTGGFTLLDGDTLTPEAGFPTVVGSLKDFSWSPDGSRLAISHESGKRVSVLNVATKALISFAPDYTGWGVNGIAYSPDGTMIAVSGPGFGVVEILNATDGTLLQSLTNRSGGIGQGVAWSPDGSMIVQGHNAAPFMTVWETAGWTPVAAAPSLGATGVRVSWSPNGDYIAFCHSVSPWFSVVRVSDWTVVSGTFNPGIAAYEVAYSPLGEIALAYNAAPYARVLNASGTTTVWTPSPPVVAPTRLAWSPAAAPKIISGTVVDENAAPAVRDLLLMHDASEAIVGGTTSAVDGSYSIATPYSDGHTVLLLEDTGRVQAVGGGIIPL